MCSGLDIVRPRHGERQPGSTVDRPDTVLSLTRPTTLSSQ
jgi:hypothetical protein